MRPAPRRAGLRGLSALLLAVALILAAAAIARLPLPAPGGRSGPPVTPAAASHGVMPMAIEPEAGPETPRPEAASLADESFSEGLLEYPQYTRPAVFRGLDVPAILTSGDHAAVDRWRRDMARERTRTRRPDLLPDD